jgi:hypothetical protein
LRYRSWIPFGEHGETDLRLVTYLDHIDGIKTDMLIVGRDRLILSELTEGVESLPQIPGWIMSECRRRLWDTMRLIGLENVAYIDTDSIIVRMKGGRDGLRAVKLAHPDRWAEKARYQTMMIRGPRNLELNSQRRISGLPLSAEQTGDLEFSGDVLRSIRESMRGGELGTVTSVRRTFTFHTPDMRRQHVENGRTEPFRIDLQ